MALGNQPKPKRKTVKINDHLKATQTTPKAENKIIDSELTHVGRNETDFLVEVIEVAI